MRNPFERIRQRLVRRRLRLGPRSRGTSTTAKLAVIVVLAILAAGMLLELRGRRREAGLLEYVSDRGGPPLELIGDAGRRHRLFFLGDVPGAAGPKRLAAEAIDTLATAYGLDAVVLDVASDEQPWIDSYLETAPEDASILLTRPRTLRESEGTANAYLQVYRRVWQLNQRLGPDRRIRIIAADLPGWPPLHSLAPSQAAVEFAKRDAYMYETVRTRLLDRSARARVLFFVDGLHVLKGRARAQTGGTTALDITFLAGQFEQRYPREVYSVLVDAPAGRAVAPAVARFQATRAFDVLRARRPADGDRIVVPASAALDLAPDMILVSTQPGMNFTIVPDDYDLASLIDAYIFVGN